MGIIPPKKSKTYMSNFGFTVTHISLIFLCSRHLLSQGLLKIPSLAVSASILTVSLSKTLNIRNAMSRKQAVTKVSTYIPTQHVAWPFKTGCDVAAEYWRSALPSFLKTL